MFAYVVNTDFGTRELVWVDYQGDEEPLAETSASYGEPRISPNGRELAMILYGTRLCYVWTYDLERGSMTRVTFEGDNHGPLWTPDGEALTYSRREGSANIYTQPADGSGSAEIVYVAQGRVRPGSWSPDGTTLAFHEHTPGTGYDLWVLHNGEERRSFLQTPFMEQYPEFSPDGKWIAYGSNETGRSEVYIRPYPGPGRKVSISIDGGVVPRWSSSGDELFFRAPLGEEGGRPRTTHRRVMAVSIEIDPDVRVGQPRLLFDGANYIGGVSYDVAPDGKRFVMVKAGADAIGEGAEIRVVVNWFEELERLVPTN